MALNLENINAQTLIDNLPVIVWLKDNHMRYVAVNSKFKKLVGISDASLVLEKDDYHLPWERYADLYRQGDQYSLRGDSKIFLHPLKLFNQCEVLILTRKSPFYDSTGAIVGISGAVTIITDLFKVKNFLKLNTVDCEFAAFNQNKPFQYTIADCVNQFKITRREFNCLFYLMRGKTAKEIALLLHISKRTVEAHINNIKLKMTCRTKSELISKAFDEGFLQIIPNDFFVNQLRHDSSSLF